jgi:uncharacterized RDD family membrane protein YckC
MATRSVSEVGLTLAAELRGAELASPTRRLAAFLVDGAIVFIPSVIVAIAVSWAALALREPAALAALGSLITGRATTPEAQHRANRDLVPLLVKYDMPGTPAAATAAYEEGDLDRAAEVVANIDIGITISTEESPTVIGDTADMIHIELARLIPPGLRLISFYGVAALYFSWFTSRRRGATPGKRLLGLEVVRLDGTTPGLVVSFERFVGYAQILASFLTALLDLWRDPNRRLPHDRLAGTLVVRRQQAGRTVG